MLLSSLSVGAISPLSSITAILTCSGVEKMVIRVGATITAIMKIGISNVVAIKLFLVTRSRNSRRIIIPMLDFIILY